MLLVQSAKLNMSFALLSPSLFYTMTGGNVMHIFLIFILNLLLGSYSQLMRKVIFPTAGGGGFPLGNISYSPAKGFVKDANLFK